MLYSDYRVTSPDPELEQNMHYLSEGEVIAFVRASIEKTDVLFDGFLGYFNVVDDTKASYKAVSSLVLAYEIGKTWIGVLLPVTKISHKQIL